MRTLYYIILFLFFSITFLSPFGGAGLGCAFSQVIINEVCSRNNTILKDEDGDFEDWIELYNTGASPFNLNNCSISDDTTNPGQWTFPAVTIQPEGFLTLFASGKNRKSFINHWETAVLSNDIWKYKVPTSPLSPSWKDPSFNTAGWSNGKGGIGYGDNDDSTQLAPPLYSVYMRRVFFISDTSKLTSAILSVDYDDSFVAYLNGFEIARANIGVNGTPPAYNALAVKEHEALMYQGNLPENFIIDYAMLKMALKNDSNVLAIEVHNVNPGSSDLSAIPFLHFGIKDNSVLFNPLPAWFTPGKSLLHTNFKLSSAGETLYLYNPSMQLLGNLTFPYTQIDNSFGCKPNGSTNTVYFGTPTPDSSNNGSTGYTNYTADPGLSLPAGFYIGAKTISATNSSPGAVMRYTTNGSVPQTFSPVFPAQLFIDTTKVIRVRAFSTTALPSEIITNTYFINDSATLPVISLSTAPDSLFDWNNGIYVLGPNAESMVPFFNANFWEERAIAGHIEYFDKQKIQGFEQDIGLEIYGNWSRSVPQKSFKMIAGGKYGSSTINYKFFPGKNISKFKQIGLRNAGNDWNNLHLRDAAIHKICQNTTNSDMQDYQPALVFINGNYWGVYDIREKINKDYIENNHGVNADSLDLLQYNGLVMSGTADNFQQFGTFVLANNFNDTANYAVLKTWLDIPNFIDYFATETYSENGDWLSNNVRFWRERKSGAKWRHILWDLDFFGQTWWSFTANSLDTNLNKAYSAQSILFNKLVQNTEFRHDFINRYADLLNTIFRPAYVLKIVNAMRDSLDPEMRRQFERWGDGFNNPTYGLPGSGTYTEWKTGNYNQFQTFVNNRQATARNHIEQTFALKKQVPVTLNVYPAGAGKIKINTIYPDSFPWAGIYFDSIPITITAVPNQGYQFAFWQSGKLIPNPDFNPIVKINIDTADAFTAYFYASPNAGRVIYSEINYSSATTLNTGDWVELHNPGTTNLNISGWTFKDGNDANAFVLPAGTNLTAGSYLVLCEDTTLFKAQSPGVNNVLGPFGFGLSSAGENLRLYDNTGALYTSVNYTSVSPWPADANGTGRTLELLDANGTANDPYNWFSGCVGGSPGGPFVPCPFTTTAKPESESMFQLTNYPNPFSTSTTIRFTLEKPETITVNIIDVQAKKIVPFITKKNLTSGEHTVKFDGENYAEGVYFYRLQTSSGLSETKMMVLGR